MAQITDQEDTSFGSAFVLVVYLTIYLVWSIKCQIRPLRFLYCCLFVLKTRWLYTSLSKCYAHSMCFTKCSAQLRVPCAMLSNSAEITGHSETWQGDRVITYFNNVRHARSHHDGLLTSLAHDRPAGAMFSEAVKQEFRHLMWAQRLVYSAGMFHQKEDWENILIFDQPYYLTYPVKGKHLRFHHLK